MGADSPVELPEAKVCRSVGEKIRADGWSVRSEVPYFERSIDLVAVRGSDLLAVEAKTSFTKRLESQIFGASWHADFAIAAVATTPRRDKIEWATRHGIGVWQVTETGAVLVLVDAVRQPDRASDLYRRRLFEKVAHMPDSVAGGLPCLDGEGPAVAAEEAIIEFRRLRPSATWDEVFAKVPNHYETAGSMRGAMLKLHERRVRKTWKIQDAVEAEAARAAARARHDLTKRRTDLTEALPLAPHT